MQLLDLCVDRDLHERVKIACELGSALLEQLVEAVHHRLVLDHRAAALAVGAAQLDAPVLSADRAPPQRMDQVAATGAADRQILCHSTRIIGLPPDSIESGV